MDIFYKEGKIKCWESKSVVPVNIGGFAQFGLNRFKHGQNTFSQIQLFEDSDELKSCEFVCSLITARQGFAKLIFRDCDHCTCPNMHLEHWCILYEDFTNMHILCTNVWGLFLDTSSDHSP